MCPTGSLLSHRWDTAGAFLVPSHITVSSHTAVANNFVVICTDLMRSFSRGLLSTTTQGLSDSAGLGEGMEGDLDGDGLPTTFLLVLGVTSLFWTRWGKRSLRICSRSSSTIWGKTKYHNWENIPLRYFEDFTKSTGVFSAWLCRPLSPCLDWFESVSQIKLICICQF